MNLFFFSFLAPPPVQAKRQKIVVKEEPKYKVKLPPKREEPPPARKEPKLFLESFYYGIYETGTDNDSGIAVKFEANVNSDFHPIFFFILTIFHIVFHFNENMYLFAISVPRMP